MTQAPTYRIVRVYRANHPRQVLKKGLTRAEALEYTNDPETTSATATSAEARAHTAQFGEWFDSFYEEFQSP